MTRNSYQMSVQGENYYREFITQNQDGIFRIDFDESIATGLDCREFSRTFFKRAFIGEHNAAFAAMNDLTNGDNSVRFAELSAQSSFFDENLIETFFESDFKVTDYDHTRTTADEEINHFLSSLTGIVENDRLVCVWGVQRDVTALENARRNADEIEKNMRMTQKIEALGRLAGGIAHDFNNFLAVIMLQNDLLNLQLPAGSPLRHRIGEMRTATNKAAAMVRQLLAIGRKQPVNPIPIEINVLVKEFEKAFPTLEAEKVKLETKIDADAGVCFVDPQQMTQSLINLAQNAVEAMPDGGTLTIETAHVVLDKDSIYHKSQHEGSFVQITVSDNGKGMDAAALESVFEPFFSTKKSTKGVGLGLATVYGFIKQSKGFIWVESEPDKGTSFKIQFPRIDQPGA